MPTLPDKHILICRQEKRAVALRKLLEEHGAKVQVFSPFKIVPIQLNAGQLKELETALKSHNGLIFGSPNAVHAFFKAINQLADFTLRTDSRHFFTVGEMAAKALRQYDNHIHISESAGTMQELLHKLSHTQPGAFLNITSLQGKEHVKPDIPKNIHLTRLALYATELNTDLSPETIAQISNNRFDVIIFSSPTSAQYSQRLLETLPLKPDGILVTTGPTTLAAVKNLYPEFPAYYKGAAPEQIYECIKNHLTV